MSSIDALISNRTTVLRDHGSRLIDGAPQVRARKNLSIESNDRSKRPAEVSCQDVIIARVQLKLYGFGY